MRQMKRHGFAAAALVLALSGCYVEGEYAYAPAAGVRVTVPPPPPRYEAPVGCGYGWAYVPGGWHWDGYGWRWQPGRCLRARPGHMWVRRYWSGGIYYRGYWRR